MTPAVRKSKLAKLASAISEATWGRRPNQLSRSYLDQFQANLGIRELESRCVLNGAPLTEWMVTAGTPDDGNADEYSVFLDNVTNELVVTVNGAETNRDDVANISKITIDGSGDDDLVTIDLSGGNAIPDCDIEIDLGGAITGDEVTIVGDAGGAITSTTHDALGANRVIEFGGITGRVIHQDVELVNDRTGVDTIEIHANVGIEDLDLGDNGIANDGISQLSSTVSSTISFLNPASSLTLDTTGGNVDIIRWSAMDQQFAADVTIISGTSDDLEFTGAVDLGNGNLDVQTIGQVIDNNATGIDLTANEVSINSGRGIASSLDPLETALNQLNANGGTDAVTSGVHVVNSGDLVLGHNSGVVRTSAGDIDVTATGSITVNGTISNVGTGGISLTTIADGGDDEHISVNARIQTSLAGSDISLSSAVDLFVNDAPEPKEVVALDNGNISLSAGRDLLLAPSVRVESVLGGDVTLTTGQHIDLANSAVVLTSSGNISANAGGHFLMADMSRVSAASGQVDIVADDNVELAQVFALSASITSANGDIANISGGQLIITSDVVFSALGTISLGTLGNPAVISFGSVELFADVANVAEDDDTDLAQVVVNSLNIVSNGDITDSGDITVIDVAVLEGNNIDLGGVGEATNFGCLILVADNATVMEDSATLIEATITNSLSIISAADIQNHGVVDVGGSASFDAATFNRLGVNFVANFGSLSLSSGGASDVIEGSATDLAFVNAMSLEISSGGPITDSGGIAVGGLATLVADNGNADITLGDAGEMTVIGSLAVDAANATIDLDATTQISGNVANDLSLTTSDSIGNNADLSVGGQANIQANNNITIGVGTIANFGRLTLSAGGAATIVEASDTLLDGVNVDSLSVTSTGTITEDAVVSVANLASFQATTAVHLGTVAVVDFGSLELIAPVATIIENSDTDLRNVDVDTLTLTTVGNVTDSGDVDVSGTATFSAANVTLGGASETTNFGCIVLNVDNATIAEDSSTLFEGTVTNSLSLTSAGDIQNHGIVDVGVLGAFDAATFNQLGANFIVNFGSLSLTSGGASEVVENSATDLAFVNALSLDVDSAGPIIDSGSITVTNLANLSANGGLSHITLGDAPSENTIIGSLAVQASQAVIAVDATTQISGNVTGDLFLTSSDGIGNDADLTVGGLASFEATSNVMIGVGTIANFGTLSLSTPGAAQIVENSATNLGAVDVLSLDLNSGGAITETGLVSVTNLATLVADNGNADVTLGGGFATLGNISVQAQNATFNLLGTTSIAGMVGTDLTVITNDDIDNHADLMVGGLASFEATNNITIGVGTIANFGRLTLSAGGAATIVEASDTLLDGVNVDSLSVTSTGTITEDNVVSVANLASFQATTAVHLGTVAVVDFGALELIAPVATIIENSDTDLRNVDVDTLTVTTVGNVTDSGDVDVSGTATFSAANVTLGGASETTNFGCIVLNVDNATIAEDSSTLFEGTVTNSLSLASAADIQNHGLVDVGGLAEFDAATFIQLGVNFAVNFGSLSLTSIGASNVVEASATDLTQVDAGSLDINSSGAITDSGSISVTNLANLVADNGNADITLGGAVSTIIGRLSLQAANATIDLDATTEVSGNIGGDLSLTTSDGIGNDADLTVGGQAFFQAAGNITLGASTTANFGTLTVSTVGAATIVEASDTVLDGVNVGALSVSSSGKISEISAITVSGLASFQATTEVDLGNVASVNFGALELTTPLATINESSDTDLRSVDVDTLAVTAAGDVADSGDVDVSGTATFDAMNVTLGGVGETTNFGCLVLQVGSATIMEDSSTLVEGSITNDLSITSTGDIQNHGVLDVGGLAEFDAGTFIQLGQTFNANFGSLSLTSVGASTVNEGSATNLAFVDALSLALNSAGTITDSGNISVTNLADLVADNGTADITLGSAVAVIGDLAIRAANATIDLDASTQVSGTVSDLTLTTSGSIGNDADLTVGGEASFQATNDITIGVGTTANFGTLGLVAGGTATIVEGSETFLDGVNVDALSVTSAGTITELSAVTVTNLASFEAAVAVDLGNFAAVNFGALELVTPFATINEDSDTDLRSVDVDVLELTAAGDVTDSGDIDVNLRSTFSAMDVTLGSAGETTNFGAITLQVGSATIMEDSSTLFEGTVTNDLSITSSGDITNDGTVDVGGLAAFDAGSFIQLGQSSFVNFGSVSLTSVGASSVAENSATDLASVNAMSLDIDSAGDITDSGTVVVTNSANLIANNGNGDITLGLVSAVIGDLSLQAANATIVLEASTQISGTVGNDLSLTTNDSIGNAADLTVGGKASFQATSDITIGVGTTANFGTLALTTGGAATVVEGSDTLLDGVNVDSLAVTSTGVISELSAIDVTNLASFQASTAVNLGSVALVDFGSLELLTPIATISENSATDLRNVDVDTLTVTSMGNVTDSGDVDVSGTATFSAVGITLGSAGETTNFGCLILMADNATVMEDSSTLFEAVITNNLSITSAGDIENHGAVSVGNLASFDAANDITLGAVHQVDFGMVGLVAGGTVTLVEAVTTLGDVNVDSLNVVSTGLISEVGNVTVTNLASFDSGTEINLGNTGTVNFGALELIAPIATIIEGSGTDLRNVDVDQLMVTANGDVVDSGDVDVSGTATFFANDIVLGSAGEVTNFGCLVLNAVNATVVEDSSTQVEGMVTNDLSVTSAGDIQNHGVLTVGGQASFDAATFIQLGLNFVVNFGSLSLTSVGASEVIEESATDLASVNVLALDLTSGGNITDSGSISVTTLATLVADNGNADITLGDLPGENTSIPNLVIQAANATINLDASTQVSGSVANDLSLMTSDSIGNDADLTVGNQAFFQAVNDITLGVGTTANFGMLGLVAGGSATVVEASDTVLSMVDVATLSVDTTGSMSETGDVTVSNLANLTATTEVNLGNVGAVNFGALQLLTPLATIIEDSGTDLRSVDTDTLNVTSNGDIVDSGNVDVSGTATLTGDNITLGSASETTNFGCLILDAVGATVIEDSSTLFEGTVSGDLSITSAGDIQNHGVVAVDGQATFDAASFIRLGVNFAVDFGSLSLTSVGASEVTESSSTDLAFVNALTLDLMSAGDITDSGTIAVGDSANLVADGGSGDITLGDAVGENTVIPILAIQAANATVVLDATTQISGAIGNDLSLATNGNIENNAALTVGNQAFFQAANNITLGVGTTANFGSLGLDAGGAATVVEASDTLLTFVDVDSLSLDSAGSISELGDVTVTNLASLQATTSINLGNTGTVNFGAVELTTPLATIVENSATDLRNVNVDTLNVTSNGNLTDSGDVDVSGTATLSADDIVLGDGMVATNFGCLILVADNATVVEDSSTLFEAMVTGNLSLVSAGDIQNHGVVSVGGQASFDAATFIQLGLNFIVNFGTLSLISVGTSEVVESSDSDLAFVDVMTLDLSSGGNITDSGSISVTGQALLTANGGNGDITFGDAAGENTVITSLSVEAANATIDLDATTQISGTVGNALSLSTNADIGNDADLTVGGQATFAAMNNITLGVGTTANFGQLELVAGGAANVVEASDTLLSFADADSLSLNSTGSITETGDVTVTNLASLEATVEINLGGSGTVNFGAVELVAPSATIVEDSATDLRSVLVDTLNVNSNGNLTDSGNVEVNGTATLSAADIVLGSLVETTNFGCLVLNADNATIEEDSSTLFEAVITGNLSIVSAGDIENHGVVTVGNQASFDGANITLGVMDTVDFGTLVLMATGQVTVVENSDTLLGSVNVDSLSVSSTGRISELGDVTVTNLASFQAGTEVDLGNVGTVNFGSLELITPVATINESSDTDLRNVDVDTLTVTSNGNLTDSGDVDVSGTATLAASDIVLGSAGETTNFGCLVLMATNATVIEDSSTLFEGTVTNDLSLTSAGDIQNHGIATVGGQAIFDAATFIQLGQNFAVNFGTLSLTSAGTSSVVEASATDLAFVDVLSLDLNSGGAITDSGSISVGTVAMLAADNGNADITLGDAAGENTVIPTLVVQAANATIQLDATTQISGSVATDLNLATTDSIGNNADLTVGGQASFSATNNIELGVGTTANFGTLALVAGGSATVVEDSDTTLASVNVNSLSLNSSGSILELGDVTVTGLATLQAATEINLGNIGIINFGAVELFSPVATIIEDSDTDLRNVDVDTLNVTSNGNLMDSGNVDVSGTATLSATDIVLGSNTETTNFGCLVLNAVNATIEEDSSTLFEGMVNNDLSLTSVADIQNHGVVSVGGQGTFAAATFIQLGLNFVVNFGSLRLTSTGTTEVTEGSATDLAFVDVLSLTLNSDGAITDSGSISVGTTATLVADNGNADITLGDAAGENTVIPNLIVQAANATVQLDATTQISGTVANDLTLSTTDSIGNDADLTVDGSASFTASNNIMLGVGTTANFGTLELIAGGAATVVEGSDTTLAFVDVDTLSLDSAGMIAELSDVTVTGLATLVAATEIDLGSVGTVNFGAVALFSPLATIVESSATDLRAVDADTLSVTSTGNLTDSGNVDVSGTATLSATEIVLGSNMEVTNFGCLILLADNATIVEDSSTLFDAMVTGTLSIDSAGDIQNHGIVSVGGLATFDAATFIQLGVNFAVDFGSLSLTSVGATQVIENSATDLAFVDVLSLDLNSGGAITDSGAVSVTTVASLVADNGNTDITLGDAIGENTVIAMLAVQAANATIDLDAATLISGTVGNNLSLSTSDTIGNDADLTVGNLASFLAVNGITLGVGTTANFGTLQLVSDGGATVVEASDTLLALVDLDFLNLDSAGTLSELGAVNVTNLATLVAANEVNLGNVATVNFGALDLTTPLATIVEDSNTDLRRADVDTLNVTSNGNLADSGDIDVSGTATLSANDIVLGSVGETTNFGCLILLADNATVMEDSSTLFEAMISGDLNLVSAGDIQNHGVVAVDGLATFNAATFNQLGLTFAVDFGTLSLTSTGASDVVEASATELVFVDALSLSVTAAGDITDSGPITVADLAAFAADNGNADVTIGDTTTAIFGTLSVLADDVSVLSPNTVDLAFLQANQLQLESLVAIQDSGDVTVAGEAVLTAPSVTLGGDAETTNFGDVRLFGGDFEINEDSDTIVNQADVASLVYRSAGTMTNGTDAIEVLGSLALQADQDINILANPGLPAGTNEISADEIVMVAGGTLTIEELAVLESTTGLVTNAPPILSLGEADPNDVLLPGDPTQEISGTLGGVIANGDNLELVQNLTLTAFWPDGEVSVLTGLNAGDSVTWFVAADGTSVPTIVPGAGTGPITIFIERTYSIVFLSSLNATEITTLFQIDNDANIALDDSRMESLNLATTTVTTSLAEDDIGRPAIVVDVDRSNDIISDDAAAVVLDSPSVVQEQANRQEELASRQVNEKIKLRQLFLIKLNADGTKSVLKELPLEYLTKIQELLDRFKQNRLPNGNYQIQLFEEGFEPRTVIGFRKSGNSIGDPVREPGRGANPLEESTDVDQNGVAPPASPEVDDSAEGNAVPNESDQSRTEVGAEAVADVRKAFAEADAQSFSRLARLRRRMNS